jgi:hypothetical protein
LLFIDLSDPEKMTERKRKRNARTSKARDGFRICKKPVLRVAVDDRLHDVGDSVGLPRFYGPPILFAIARDSRTIFVSWNIDWPLVFEKLMPVDRQVHLRVYRADGLEEKTVAVEPMAATDYVTISDPHGSYCVEIGYYRPADVWHSVAMSNEVLMPRNEVDETADVDIAMIPFHVSFQQLVDLFEPTSDTALATIIARFQERALSSEEPKGLSPEEEKILRKLNVSLSEIATARRVFDQTDCEKLARRAGVLSYFGSTSPSRGFEGDWASAGS